MRIGEVLRDWRLMNRLTVREVAKLIGIKSASTLCRLENGKACDAETLGRIIAWLVGGKRPTPGAGGAA